MGWYFLFRMDCNHYFVASTFCMMQIAPLDHQWSFWPETTNNWYDDDLMHNTIQK